MTRGLKWVAVIGGIGAAGALAFYGVEGWGWFLLVAVLAAG